VEAAHKTRSANIRGDQEASAPWTSRLGSVFRRGSQLSTVQEKTEDTPPKGDKTIEPRKLRPDMIRRMDDAPKLVNPSGWISESNADSLKAGVDQPDRSFTSSPTALENPAQQLTFADDVKDSNSSASPSVSPAKLISIRKSRSPSRYRSVGMVFV